MAVLLETSLGDITIDLFIDEVPLLAANFLKLCKYKHYNNSVFHSVEKNFIARAGSQWEGPTHSTGVSSSIVSIVKAHDTAAFESMLKRNAEETRVTKSQSLFSKVPCDPDTGMLWECFHPRLRHNQKGIVAMANDRPNTIGSSFYITLRDSIDYLDNKRSIIGVVTEGLEVINALNMALVDHATHQPLRPIRILHTVILEDPFPDPAGRLFDRPIASPLRSEVETEDGTTKEPVPESVAVENEIAALERIARSEAKSRAVALEILGDIPDADVAPPDNVLFICKLNPVTEASDLELIFSRFGKILSCEIIRDWKTGDSLQYGFIEFEDNKACERALFKMEGCLIDDRRIHVNFCQSVSKQWNAYRRFGPRQKPMEPESAHIPEANTTASGKDPRSHQNLGFLFHSEETREPPSTDAPKSTMTSNGKHTVVQNSDQYTAIYGGSTARLRSPNRRFQSPQHRCRSPYKTPESQTPRAKHPYHRDRTFDRTAKTPGRRARSSERRASPDSRVKSPHRRFRSPDPKVISPERRAKSPRRRVKSSDRRARSPDHTVKSPARRALNPDGRVRSPARRALSPDGRVRSPARRARSPDRRVRSPDRRVRVRSSDHLIILPTHTGESLDSKTKVTRYKSRTPDRRSRSRTFKNPSRRHSRTPSPRVTTSVCERQRSSHSSREQWKTSPPQRPYYHGKR